jgi:hypothetical protein
MINMPYQHLCSMSKRIVWKQKRGRTNLCIANSSKEAKFMWKNVLGDGTWK